MRHLRLANRHHNEPFDVYIGRGSPFGNPYSVRPSSFDGAIRVSSTDEAISRYRTWLLSEFVLIPGWIKPTHAQIASLHGKVLGCFCAPNRCHGEVLIELAERFSIKS